MGNMVKSFSTGLAIVSPSRDDYRPGSPTDLGPPRRKRETDRVTPTAQWQLGPVPLDVPVCVRCRPDPKRPQRLCRAQLR